MMAGRRSNSSGGGAVLFGVLILIAVVIKYYWWFIAAAAVVGLFFAVRALARYVRERKAIAAREAEELAYRADRAEPMGAAGRQPGCVRCRGAELMRSISPELLRCRPTRPESHPRSRRSCTRQRNWPGCSRRRRLAGAGRRSSVLVQRQAAVRPRLRDCELGLRVVERRLARTAELRSARFVTDCMDEVRQLVGQSEAFMLTPAFMEVFGSKGDESTADADGIVHVANRLMDYHERFLKLGRAMSRLPGAVAVHRSDA